MEVILIASTILGGLAAIWFFWDRAAQKLFKIRHFTKKKLDMPTILENKYEIALDLSYRQNEWFGKPTIREGYQNIFQDLNIEVKSIAHGYQSPESIDNTKVLILPTPFGTMVNDDEYENLSNWVYAGGGLLITGIYLMESHHYSNLNQLARRFGFEFSKNLTMPIGKEDFYSCMDQSFTFQNKEYWIIDNIESNNDSHPILNGVSRIGITSACTISDPMSSELIIGTSSSVAHMHAKGRKSPDGRLVQLTDYILDKHDKANHMIALKHGKGRVIGIGSWKIFLNEMVEDSSLHNKRLFVNSFAWLKNKT